MWRLNIELQLACGVPFDDAVVNAVALFDFLIELIESRQKHILSYHHSSLLIYFDIDAITTKATNTCAKFLRK
jgi:hypothetical protein